jgi:uncharacterized protein involved in exopolysaccharide biosynthesis
MDKDRQVSGVRRQMTEVRRQMTEVRKQMTEVRKQMTDDRRQRAEALEVGIRNEWNAEVGMRPPARRG